MLTFLKWYVLPALGIVCILTSWQGICAHPNCYERDDVNCSAGIYIVDTPTHYITPPRNRESRKSLVPNTPPPDHTFLF